MTRITRLVGTFLLLLLPVATAAQSPYSAAVKINTGAVTWFEIEQRALLMRFLGVIGDVEKQAKEVLIDAKLQEQAARSLGIGVSQEELDASAKEFAGRVQMEPEQLLAEMEKVGIYAETFFDFLRSQQLWVKVVGQKFQPKAFVTDAELDAALSSGTTSLGASVLLSEIVLAYDPETEADTLELLNSLRGSINSSEDFELTALTYSMSATRGDGGKLDWIPLANLPEDIQIMMLNMGVGNVTRPIQLNNAYVIYQLRGVRDNRAVQAQTVAYDYAVLRLPGTAEEAQAKAERLKGEVDTCNDLLAKSQAYPAEYFSQSVVPIRQVPRQLAVALAGLDANEVTTLTTPTEAGSALSFVMLCGRTTKLAEGDREQIRIILFNQRMEAFGNGYLQELKGDAHIVFQ